MDLFLFFQFFFLEFFVLLLHIERQITNVIYAMVSNASKFHGKTIQKILAESMNEKKKIIYSQSTAQRFLYY